MIHYVKDFALQRGGEEMFEKNLAISDLLFEYAAVLSERHRELLDLYYNQDLSLAEIAAEVGISRQGVRDGIKKAERELFALEDNLHLVERFFRIRAEADLILKDCCAETKCAVQRLLDAAGVALEGEEGAPNGNV